MINGCFQLFIYPGSYRPTYPCNEKGYQKASNLINIHNGKRNIYKSIYNYIGEPDAQNALIDKVYIDFDPDGDKVNPINEARKLTNYLQEKNILHTLYFSGRGTHVYIYMNPVMAQSLQNPSMAIKNYVYDISEELNLSPDWQVVGDLRRVSRIPNTINLKTDLFCIPLIKDEMKLEDEEIFNIAKKQRWGRFPVGKDRLDIKKYDDGSRRDIPKLDYKGMNLGDDIQGVPKCVEAALKRGEPNYQERFIIITCLRDLAYSQEDVENILQKYLTPDKFYHCVMEERQIDYLFRRQDLIFPKCETIESNGLCVHGCNGQNIYL